MFAGSLVAVFILTFLLGGGDFEDFKHFHIISMISFFENNPDYEPEEVFFLDYGIHPANKGKLDGIAARYGRRITYLNAKAVTDVVKREYPNLKGWHGSMAPNAKPFVEQIIPDYVERLLFIDADTVVAGSVAELKTIDMSGKALGVVPVNLGGELIRKGKLKLVNGSRIYFNSGVLLFNLPVRTLIRHSIGLSTQKLFTSNSNNLRFSSSLTFFPAIVA